MHHHRRDCADHDAMDASDQGTTTPPPSLHPTTLLPPLPRTRCRHKICTCSTVRVRSTRRGKAPLNVHGAVSWRSPPQFSELCPPPWQEVERHNLLWPDVERKKKVRAGGWAARGIQSGISNAPSGRIGNENEDEVNVSQWKDARYQGWTLHGQWLQACR